MQTKRRSTKGTRTPKSSAAKRPAAKKKVKSSSSSVSHVLVPGSNRPVAKFAMRVGDVNPNDRIEVTLDLKAPTLPGADELPEKALTPTGSSARTVFRRRALTRSRRCWGNSGCL